jgi:hypothetical protein
VSRRKVTHSEDWWLVHAPAHVLRCEAHYKTGEQCRREAIPGSHVCRQHGGASPHVMAAAAARIQNTADEAVKVLHAILTDPSADDRNKILVAKDFLDRAGLVPTNKVLLGVVTDDPVEKLFRTLLSDPMGLVDPSDAHPHTPSAEVLALNRAQIDMDDDVPDWGNAVEAEVVEDRPTTAEHAEEPYKGGTPKHIREAMEALL